MKLATLATAAALTVLAALPAAAQFGAAGILDRSNRSDLAPLTLSVGKPVASETYMLRSGGYYRITIVGDGTGELALSGADFFRAVWVNEVVINELEVRPFGLASIEFDDAGEMEISFVAILPGTYELKIPGSSGDTQKAVFVIQ